MTKIARVGLMVLTLLMASSSLTLSASAQTASGTPLCRPSVTRSPNSPESHAYEIAPPLANYVSEEYFVTCNVDGVPYTTIVQVRRPVVTSHASGIAIAEVWHWFGGWASYARAGAYMARKNYTMIFMAANPSAVAKIKAADPKRYARLSLPWTPADLSSVSALKGPQEYEIYTQVGALIKSGGIPGLRVRKMIMAGMSVSAGQVRRYIEQEAKTAKVNGKNIYDGYFPSQTSVQFADKPIPDLDVPVVEVWGETELIRSFIQQGGHGTAYRRPDGPLYRLYEVAGMSHLDSGPTATEYWVGMRETPPTYDCNIPLVSNFPSPEIYGAALDSLVNWVDKGLPAPHAPRIETNADGSVIYRDEYGNAKGGIRTSVLDVPTATINVLSRPPGDAGPGTHQCFHIGSLKLLSNAQLLKLYPNHAVYEHKVNAALDRLVAGHWYLPEDARVAREEARVAPIP